jgi:hypothetical protein
MPTVAKLAATPEPVPPEDPACASSWIVSVPNRTGRRADVSGRELAHRGLADNQRASTFEPRDDCGVRRRNEILEAGESVRRRHVARIDLVLDEDGDTVERSDGAAGFERGIQSLGFLYCPRVDGLHSVQRGTGLVMGMDAFQVELDEAATTYLLRPERRLHVVDRRFDDIERRRCRRGARRLRRDDGDGHPCRRDCDGS